MSTLVNRQWIVSRAIMASFFVAGAWTFYLFDTTERVLIVNVGLTVLTVLFFALLVTKAKTPEPAR